VPTHHRAQLERLRRYTARGAVALERLDVNADGDLLYTFTPPWSDGTTGITLSPLELLEKLAVLVPLLGLGSLLSVPVVTLWVTLGGPLLVQCLRPSLRPASPGRQSPPPGVPREAPSRRLEDMR
jgi:hypothetical protein